MKPLEGPRLRIRRAKSELEALHLAMRALSGSYQHRVVATEYNPQSRRYALRMRIPQLPPDDWGVATGEIAHNFRAALDNLVWQLALLDNNEGYLLGLKRAEKPQFPIYIDAKTFQYQGIQCLAKEHQATIERSQPYHAGREAATQPLTLLQELNNADKHRVLPVTVIRNLSYGYGTFGPPHCEEPFIWLPEVTLADGALIAWACQCRIPYPQLNANVNVGQLSEIAFGDGCEAIKGWPVSPVLQMIANKVTGVLESFAPFLD